MIFFAGWWKKHIRHLGVIGIITVCVGIGALIFAGYWFNWEWTGFNAYITPLVSSTQQYQREKTLWDWMQLFIIPVGLAIFAFWYNRREQKATEQRAKIESDRTLEFQRQATLQAYIDRMSELLLNKDINALQHDDRFLAVARANTLTVLSQMDAKRKGSLMQFLSESQLLSIIKLSGADLSGANLQATHLTNATLNHANLSNANLRFAILDFANLSVADLRKADLRDTSLYKTDISYANLSDADLRNADLNEVQLTQAQLINVDLRGATISEGTLYMAKTYAILSNTNLNDAMIKKEVKVEQMKPITGA